jgi:hypothetical protein
MKKFIIILFLAPVLSYAQGCIVTQDPKTGKEAKSGVTFLINPIDNSGGTIAFAKLSDKIHLDFVHTFNSKGSNKNGKMYLIVKFTNGETKKFICNKVVKMPVSDDIINLGMADIEITEFEISYLSKNVITSIRACYQDDESIGYDLAIDPTEANNIIKSVECIL